MKKLLIIVSISFFSTFLWAHEEQAQIPTFILFSHGLRGSEKQAHRYAGTDEKILPYELFTFNYPEAISGSVKEVSLGQDNEIELFDTAFNAMLAEIKRRKIKKFNIIIIGVSRGASTIINWMATHPKSLDYITVVILESPFDSVETILEQRRKDHTLGWLVPQWITRWIAKKLACGAYNHKSIHPIHSAAKIARKDLPIFIVWSKEDIVVPYIGTKKIYNQFIQHGHTNITHVSLETGVHANLLWGQTGHIYKDTLNQFLKKHLNA